MKTARVMVLVVALGAGGVAAILASGDKSPAPVAEKPVKQIDMVDVLVARTDIGIGNIVRPDSINWEAWPAAAAGPHFIKRTQSPNAPEVLSGAIARVPFVKGEPIREAKLIKGDGSGFMAAMLPAGMRAISVEISPETGAGGFILPNDRVDVIVTKRSNGEKGDSSAETALVNVRVLAIDQTIEEKNGEKVVVGKTATLELNGRQTEVLAQARQGGNLTLALRSLADAASDEPFRGAVTLVRYGIPTTASR